MHYTEAARTAQIAPFGTINQHVDQNLPTTAGSTISAEFVNALMFEIAQCITYAGLTIEADSVTDRSNEFAQLKTAIFLSGAIDTDALADEAVTDDKIYSVSLDKLIAGDFVDSIVSGDITYNINFKFSETYQLFQMYKTDVSGSVTVDTASLTTTALTINESILGIVRDQCQIKNSGILIQGYDAAGEADGLASLTQSGLTFLNSWKAIRHKVISLSSVSFSSSGSDYLSASFDTGLPLTAKILMAQVSYDQTVLSIRYIGNTGRDASDCFFDYASEDTIYGRVLVSDDISGEAYDNQRLTIIYSDS